MQSTEVVGPGLRKLLVAVLVLFSLLVVDSVYLATITFLQWLNDVTLEMPSTRPRFWHILSLVLSLLCPQSFTRFSTYDVPSIDQTGLRFVSDSHFSQR